MALKPDSIEATCAIAHICQIPPLLRLFPASDTRPPAIYILAIFDIVRAELLAQRRLFIEDNKQMHRNGNGCHGDNCYRVGVSEDHPKSNPSRGQAQVHWVPHISVETHHY